MNTQERYWHKWILCLMLITPTLSSASEEERLAIQYLRSEFPQLSSGFTGRLQNNPVHVVADIELGYSSPNPAAKYQLRVTAKRDQKNYLYVCERIGGAVDIATWCHGYNGRYYFDLKRNPSNTAWLVGRYRDAAPTELPILKSANGELLAESVDGTIDSLGTTVRLADGNKAVSEVPTLPGFKVLRFRHDETTSRVAITFEYQCQVPGGNRRHVSTCDLEITSLENCPSIKLNQRHDNDGSTMNHTWSRQWTNQGNTYSGVCIFDAILKERDVTKSVTAQKIHYAINTQPIPILDFTLTAFELPEPPGVEWPRPTPTYVWLLIGAGGLGVVALAARWLLKRRSQPIPPPPSV